MLEKYKVQCTIFLPDNHLPGLLRHSTQTHNRFDKLLDKQKNKINNLKLHLKIQDTRANLQSTSFEQLSKCMP